MIRIQAVQPLFYCMHLLFRQKKHSNKILAMKGKQLFDHYQSVAQINGFGSEEFLYGNLLYQALKIEGEEKIFQLLEVAEETGKRIGLEYPMESIHSYPQPDKVVLV